MKHWVLKEEDGEENLIGVHGLLNCVVRILTYEIFKGMETSNLYSATNAQALKVSGCKLNGELKELPSSWC